MAVYDIYGNAVESGSSAASGAKRIDTRTICHQGYHANAEANTRSAFVDAYRNGFSVVETDIQMTSDGVMVISHDAVSVTFEEWKTSDERLTFAEFLDLMKYLNMEFYLDGKTGMGSHKETIYAEVVKRGLLDKATFTGTLSGMHTVDANARCASLIGNLGSDLSGYREGQVLYCNYVNVTAEEAQNAIDNGFTLEVYTLSTAGNLLNFVSRVPQASRFCTDNISVDSVFVNNA